MYQSNVLKVCDYVSLNIAESLKELDTSTYKWDIPQSAYMSNQRSQVCTVEVTGGVIGCTIENPLGMVIYYLNGGYNHYSSKGHPAIGSVSKNTSKGFAVTGTGQTLTQARPQAITLKFVTHLGETLTKNQVAGSITLKFSYYDAVGTGRDMQHEKTISL